MLAQVGDRYRLVFKQAMEKQEGAFDVRLG